ncbi:MAG: hypothetical protein QM802_01540 [Agriterribacter sp.]
MMKNAAFFLLAVTGLFLSCTKQNDFNNLEIRVYNSTPVEVTSISIAAIDRELIFDSLTPGFTTGYKTLGISNLTNPACIISFKDQSNVYHVSDNEAAVITKGSYTCHIKYINGQPCVKFVKE